MKRINRSEIDRGFVFYGDPKTAIYAIYIDDDESTKWVAASASEAIKYAGMFGDSLVAEIAEGVTNYTVEYLNIEAGAHALGKHALHNVNPRLDVQIDCESIRTDDIFYLCHYCQRAFILTPITF